MPEAAAAAEIDPVPDLALVLALLPVGVVHLLFRALPVRVAVAVVEVGMRLVAHRPAVMAVALLVATGLVLPEVDSEADTVVLEVVIDMPRVGMAVAAVVVGTVDPMDRREDSIAVIKGGEDVVEVEVDLEVEGVEEGMVEADLEEGVDLVVRGTVVKEAIGTSVGPILGRALALALAPVPVHHHLGNDVRHTRPRAHVLVLALDHSRAVAARLEKVDEDRTRVQSRARALGLLRLEVFEEGQREEGERVIPRLDLDHAPAHAHARGRPFLLSVMIGVGRRVRCGGRGLGLGVRVLGWMRSEGR